MPYSDIAQLAGVPEAQLRVIVRLTATAGFLNEPHPACVAHSALSASYITKPSYLDALMFLSGTAAPVALCMTKATQRFGESQKPHDSAYNAAFNTPMTFAGVCEQHQKLQRQWPAFLRHTTGNIDLGATNVLTCIDWSRFRHATVVEVSIF